MLMSLASDGGDTSMRRRQVLRVGGVAIAPSVAGCSGVFENANSSYQNGTYIGCSGDTHPNRIEFDCDRFDGATGRMFRVEAGSALAVTSRTDIDAGSIRFLARDPDDGVLWEHAHDEAGTHEAQTSIEAADTGRYEMRVEGDDIEGSFELRWDVKE